MVDSVHSALILNSDSTQYAVALDCHGNVKVVYVPKSEPEKLDRRGENGNEVLPEEKAGSLTQFFIKYYLLMNALGNISTLVYIIADENITTGQCRIHEVPILAHGVSLNDTAYVLCND